LDFKAGEILLVNKPLEWTSFDVVKFLKFRLQAIEKVKVGHAGTLDPLATGLLIICTGKATKKIIDFQYLGKTYTGTIRLGATTPCYDREMPPNCFYPTKHITEDDINQNAQKLTGWIDQQVPLYSAVKQNGKKLYKLARKGKVIETKSRKVEVKSFKITKVKMPYIDFEIECSKGTYIRSLAHDLGKALNSGGFLWSLKRTHIGQHKLTDAWELDDLTEKIRLIANTVKLSD